MARTVKITKRVVDQLAPMERDGRPFENYVWDNSVRGVGVTPNGSKSSIYQYRMVRGREGVSRCLTIGQHGQPWMLETARIDAELPRMQRRPRPTRA